MSAREGIAIVGMACRFPGAPDVDAYWDLLRAGRDAITRYPAAPNQRRDYVGARGDIEDPLTFDWSLFRYSRAEAATIDPQQRVFLQCASTAIDDAGLDPDRFPGWIGCYAGCDYSVSTPDPGLDPLTLVIGRDKDFLATRVAYKLGLRGPAMTVQTACSTSLAAVHVAMQSLLGYECDVALAGGVTVTGPARQGYLYREGGILSPDGHCRPFDAAAAGTVPGEGVGVVVLQRLADALRDRDRVIAVILASAVNNDGSAKVGYTAPSVSGQRDVIQMAQRIAGIEPAEVGYVEAHGTATRIGDPIEVQGLTSAFGESRTGRTCWLGSVKGNIGHAGAAAGVAGLIKTALMLQRGEIVPTAHFSRPNPLLHLEDTPFRVAAQCRPWPAEAPYAGVSSFGVGGTNVHAVLAPPPRVDGGGDPGGHGVDWEPARGTKRLQLLVLSTTTAEAMQALRDELSARLQREPEIRMADVAWTLAGRRRLGYRSFVLARTAAAAAHELARPDGAAPVGGDEARVAFLFPGQGTLRHGAAGGAYRRLPGFQDVVEEVAAVVDRRCLVDLSPVKEGDAPAGWFTDTVHQQLGLFAIGYAASRALERAGIKPDALLGNSIGEYVAAAVAEVWDVEDAVQVIHARAQAMRDSPDGRMLAVRASVEQLASVIAAHPEVSVAVRHHDSVVLSGSVAAMQAMTGSAVLAEFATRPIETNHAFHSPLMRPVAEKLTAALAQVTTRAPSCQILSNATGGWLSPEELADPAYWVSHLSGTVRLDDNGATLLGSGCDVFVELGPGTSMISYLRREPLWRPELLAVPLLGRPSGDEDAGLLTALGRLWARGIEVPLEELLRPGGPRRCQLPGHPFLRKSPEATGDIGRSEPPPGEATRAEPRSDGYAILADLWCRALATPAVTENDDFFVAGGESLALVQLLGRIRDEAGWDIPVSEFMAAPTFRRLVELATAARTATTPRSDTLLRLADGGAGDPLFLVADGFGHTIGYQGLAGLLNRPVFGLEFKAGASRIEELAEDLSSALRPWRQTPILLGGWSFGAVVAHEIARRMPEADIRRLLLLDGYAPHTGGRPIAADRRLLTSVFRIHCDSFLRRGPIGQRLARVPATRPLFLRNLRAMLRYRPGPVQPPASVFKAGADHARVDRLERRLMPLYPAGVRVHAVPGDHWSMLQPPHVTLLAQLIQSSVARERVRA